MTVTVEEFEARFREILDKLAEGSVVFVDRPGQPSMMLTAEVQRNGPVQLGAMKGSVLYMAPDFNDTPEEFKEYME